MRLSLSRIFLALTLIMIGAWLSACSTTPAALQGHYTEVYPQDLHNDDYKDVRVRWGGRIINTVPEKDHSCIYVLAYKLDHAGRPIISNQSQGRFAACQAGFLDPAQYRPDQDISFTGVIGEHIKRKVGSYDYAYPTLDISTMHVWPERVPVQVIQPMDPFWSPWYMNPYAPYHRPYLRYHHRH